MQKSPEVGRMQFFELCDELLDEVVGGDPIICGALQTAGTPAAVNATSGVTGLTQDADDCDIWDPGGRIIDFVPFGD